LPELRLRQRASYASESPPIWPQRAMSVADS
jgi:hypothetical protein